MQARRVVLLDDEARILRLANGFSAGSAVFLKSRLAR